MRRTRSKREWDCAARDAEEFLGFGLGTEGDGVGLCDSGLGTEGDGAGLSLSGAGLGAGDTGSCGPGGSTEIIK